jgi:hypothetical protein
MKVSLNRRIILIALMLVLIICLGIAIFILGKPQAASVREQQFIEEYTFITGIEDAKDISSVRIRNSQGEFILSGGEDGMPVIHGLEGIPIDALYFIRVLNASRQLISRSLITNEAMDQSVDLTVFGFNYPQAEVFMESIEGESAILVIGSNAPDNINVYVKLDGSATVHLASFYDIEILLKNPRDFISTALTPAAQISRTGELPFEKITFGGEIRQGAENSGEISIVSINPADKAWTISNFSRIISPVNAALGLGSLSVLESLFGLSADRVIAKIEDKNELMRYGLAEPWSTAKVSRIHGAGDFYLRVSRPDNTGLVYIQREEIPLIYAVSAHKLPWLEVTWFELMEKLILLPFIDSVASVDIKTSIRTVTFLLSGENDRLTVKTSENNMNINSENFRIFYQTLIEARYDEYSDVSAAALTEPFLEIIYRYRDNARPADTIGFYELHLHQGSSRYVFSSLNRGKPYFTRSFYTDKVLADLDLLLAGQRVRSYL